MEEETSTLSVAIRVRPLNEREKSNGQRFVWKIQDQSIEQTWKKSDSKRKQLATYAFDRVFGPESKNEEVRSHISFHLFFFLFRTTHTHTHTYVYI